LDFILFNVFRLIWGMTFIRLWIVMCAEDRPMPNMDTSILDLYKGYLKFSLQILFTNL
jgi:hypothetical protein